MPIASWLPPVPRRARRPLAALLVVAGAAALGSFLLARGERASVDSTALCHPSLSRLRGDDGSDVLLIGMLHLDLDGASDTLVKDAIGALRPDVVMVEGSWAGGVNAMMFSGRWEMHGAPPAPGKVNWTDIGDAQPVELPKPRRRHFLSFHSGPARWPERSLVPVKVGSWAFHLRGSVGGGIATALASAAAGGVPIRFLGPQDGGLQGHVHVQLLAQRAAQELLEEEQQRGAEMDPKDVDEALRRAEGHVRDEAGRWLQDTRSENSKLEQSLNDERMPKNIRETVMERMDERLSSLAQGIAGTMTDHARGAVILGVEQLVGVESKLLGAGYTYVSNCA